MKVTTALVALGLVLVSLPTAALADHITLRNVRLRTTPTFPLTSDCLRIPADGFQASCKAGKLEYEYVYDSGSSGFRDTGFTVTGIASYATVRFFPGVSYVLATVFSMEISGSGKKYRAFGNPAALSRRWRTESVGAAATNTVRTEGSYGAARVTNIQGDLTGVQLVKKDPRAQYILYQLGKVHAYRVVHGSLEAEGFAVRLPQ